MLWEIHRLRAILLRANELQIMIRDDRLLGRDVEILKRVKALREMLECEPAVLEDQAKEERRSNWRKGLRV